MQTKAKTGDVGFKISKCTVCPYSTKYLSNYRRHVKTHSDSIEKPFKCPECPLKTKLKGGLNKHFKTVHLFKSTDSRPFPCPDSGCNYAAKEKYILKSHIKIHGDKSPEFFCSHPNCNYSTNQKGNLISHTRIHTGEKPFVCQFESCSYAAATSSHLVTHTRTHTKEKPFKCPEPNCEYSAARNGDLKQHQLTHHQKEGEERPSFKCPLCEYYGKSKKLLSEHIKRHTLEKFFKCDEPNCNYEAKEKQAIEFHRVVHSDEKTFACSFESCEYRCKWKSNLDKHLKSHSDERQYKCELCPFRAKIRQNVTVHLKHAHSDPNFRPFKCREPKCAYAAKTKGELNKHLLIHTGEKNHCCPFSNCEYKAIEESRIKQHFRNMHEIRDKVKCGLCDYSTKSKGNLVRHMRIHTKEKRVVCKENSKEGEF